MKVTDAVPSLGRYLIEALHRHGIRHVFGVPGDYVLGFYRQLAAGPLIHIGTTREDTAAFAADGYARCKGLGALAVTYGVGALNVVNAIAGAHAESSPVVVISGAPGVAEQRHDPLLHHRFGPFHFQREIFARITCATAVLNDRLTAFREIDRTLEAARHFSKPVYIELPRDMIEVAGYRLPAEPWQSPRSDPAALSEVCEETLAAYEKAKNPVVLAGVELHRRGLQGELMRVLYNANLPVAATLTGKSVVGEHEPCYLGVYEGAMGAETTRQAVENADLLLVLGATLNDVDLGIYTARLDPRRMIRAAQDEVVIGHHRYPQVRLGDFVAALANTLEYRSREWTFTDPATEAMDFPVADRPMSVVRLIARLNRFLTRDMMVIADTGDCLFSALDLKVHGNTEFLASAFYTTMGFAVPAALGAQVARPERRPVVLVGDGAFQMTGTELSTAVRLGLNPIVIVYNNCGYGTERLIHDGAFNDITPWRFHKLGELFGPLQGYAVATEADFEAALTGALDFTAGPTVIEVSLPADDPTPALRRLAQHLGARMRGAEPGSAGA